MLLKLCNATLVFGLLLLANCSSNEEPAPVDCNENPPTVSVESKTDPSSCGTANGTVTVTGAGGKSPYEFSINGGAFQSSGTFNSLNAGTFNVKVKDANDCEGIAEVTLSSPSTDLTATVVTSADSECTTNNGIITVTATSSNGPIEYKLGQGSFGAASEFGSLAKGDYTIIVKDATGCSISVSAVIGHGDTGVSWNNEIKSIIENNCAVSGCHVSGAQNPNFSAFTNVKNNAARIKTRTGNKSMPPNKSLTQTEIDKIACWVDDGAKEN